MYKKSNKNITTAVLRDEIVNYCSGQKKEASMDERVNACRGSAETQIRESIELFTNMLKNLNNILTIFFGNSQSSIFLFVSNIETRKMNEIQAQHVPSYMTKFIIMQ